MTPRFLAVVTLAASAVLGACATGERPSFDTSTPFEGDTTGDPNIDAVLTLMDGQGDGPFTATYLVTVNLGGVTTETIVAADQGRRSVTADGVRFLDEEGQRSTCILGTGDACQSEWQAQYVSDSIINPDFAGDAAARRLRRDAAAAVEPATLESTAVAGQPAQCVTIAVIGGNVQYCVLTNGVLARIVDSDVTIELTSYDPAVPDPALFATT